MARIRIELPDRFAFSTAIPLLISHINYGNHLDNAQLLGVVSEARLRFLKSLGYTELDVEGVGALVALGVERGRRTKPGLKIGVCGEHGGDPASITAFHRYGLDYVSCSPFRVPIARVAAARAALAKDAS